MAWLERERAGWFHWLPVALGAGIGLYFALPSEPPMVAVLAPFPVAFVLWRVAPRGSVGAMLLGLVLVAAFGLVLAKLRSDRVAAPVVGKRMGPSLVRGVVELVEPKETRGARLTIRVSSIEGLRADETPRRVRVRSMQAGGETLRPGDPVRVKAHLAPPSGPVLPGSYDFARGAWFQGLGAVGFALSRPEYDIDSAPDGTSWSWAAAVSRLRQDLTGRILAALPGQSGAIAAALVTGERGAISAATNDAYRDSGLYHMLSISGLHMAVMGGSVFVAVRFLLALFPAIALRFPIKKWAAAVAIVASLGYLVISGGAFATVRSAVTIVIMFTAVLFDRPALAMRNVALSALLILVVWPESLNDVGFQMSFAAVVALVACYEVVRRRLLPMARWPEGAAAKLLLFFAGIVLSTLIASVAVAPFSAYYFHKAQQLAIVANVVATPICNVVVMPAALATLVAMPFGLEAWPLAVMGFGIDLVTRTAEWVAGLPGAASTLPAIPLASFLAMTGGGIWLLLWRERPRWLGLVAIVAGIAAAPTAERPALLAGHDGRLLAVRGGDGRLAAVAGAGTSFELSRWLEHDGDLRSAKEAAAVPGFRCDTAGCMTRNGGLTIAYPRHAAAVAEDCARADVVVLSVPKPKGCTRPRLVIDFFDLRARGTHAVYVTPAAEAGADRARSAPADGPPPLSGTAAGATNAALSGEPTRTSHRAGPVIRVETVAGWRGERPWSRLPWWAVPGATSGHRHVDTGRARSRLAAFAATPEFLASQQISPRDPVVDEALSDQSLYDERW